MLQAKKERICPICGMTFYRHPGAITYCSAVCKAIAIKRRNYPSSSFPEKICAYCGKTFVPKNTHQRFCSYECCNIKQRIGYISIFERDNFRCIYCGKSSIEDGVKLHLDHIFPKSRGGSSQAKNLVTACQLCNLMKFNHVFSVNIENRILAIVENRNTECGINPETIIKLHDHRE